MHRLCSWLVFFSSILPASLFAQNKSISYCYEVAHTSGYGQTPEEACAGPNFTTLKYLNEICRNNKFGNCANRGALIGTGSFDALTSEPPRLTVRDWYGDPEFVCYVSIICRYRINSPDNTN